MSSSRSTGSTATPRSSHQAAPTAIDFFASLPRVRVVHGLRYDPKYSLEERGPYISQMSAAARAAVTSDGPIALVGPTKT